MLLAACTLLTDLAAFADGHDDLRVRAGARLFRSLLAAETGIEAHAAADGALHVVLLGNDARAAEEVGALLAPPEDGGAARIHGLAVRLETRSALPAPGEPVPVGVFLVTPPASAADLDRLVRWSIEHKAILYSPYEGHVERGATAGLSIEAKVQPYVNLTTLQAAGIELKPFFLKVARTAR